MSNFQIDLTEITPAAELSFTPLDPAYRKAHIAGTAIAYVALMALATLLLLLDASWPCLLAECLIAAAFASNMAILPKSFDAKGYALREHDLTFKSGIIFPKVTTIPFIRIQQVSVEQNPVSKFFGLYSVEVVNGAQSLSSITIPGLSEENALRLKNFVTEKLRDNND